MAHLGNRVSALLDGHLSAAEAEEAWAHVYGCHPCRDLVEREGWIKTRLAGLWADDSAPSNLKGSLLDLRPAGYCAAGHPVVHHEQRRRLGGAVAISGGALGAAMLGVIALGVAPGSAPPVERRPPVAQISPGVAGTSRFDGAVAQFPEVVRRFIP